MHVKPFACVRPAPDVAAQVAALPYDVYDRAEAARAVAGRPLSFLNIDRPETQFPSDHDMYAPEVYARAGELLRERIEDGTFAQDDEPCYYLYRLATGASSAGTGEGGAPAHVQTGFVGCCAIDDYLDGTIRRHENTRADKELDRVRHIEALDAQTGPVLLAFRHSEGLARVERRACAGEPLYDFVADDGVRHTVWRVGRPEDVRAVEEAFAEVGRTYIADGHHRMAAAARVGLDRRKRRQASVGEASAEVGVSGGTNDGGSPLASNYALAVLFPAEQLRILPYDRVVGDLGQACAQGAGDPGDAGKRRGHGHPKRARPRSCWAPCAPPASAPGPAPPPCGPSRPGTFGMYLDGGWWELDAPALSEAEAADPVARLDASILQERLLGPVLGHRRPTHRRAHLVCGRHTRPGRARAARDPKRRRGLLPAPDQHGRAARRLRRPPAHAAQVHLVRAQAAQRPVHPPDIGTRRRTQKRARRHRRRGAGNATWHALSGERLASESFRALFRVLFIHVLLHMAASRQ